MSPLKNAMVTPNVMQIYPILRAEMVLSGSLKQDGLLCESVTMAKVTKCQTECDQHYIFSVICIYNTFVVFLFEVRKDMPKKLCKNRCNSNNNDSNNKNNGHVRMISPGNAGVRAGVALWPTNEWMEGRWSSKFH